MPEDEDGNKYFIAQGNEDPYFYKIQSYKTLSSEEVIEGEPSESELAETDYLVIELQKGGDSLIPKIFESAQWQTVPGPWSTYEQVEEILEADFGEEGSRGGKSAGFTL